MTHALAYRVLAVIIAINGLLFLAAQNVTCDLYFKRGRTFCLSRAGTGLACPIEPPKFMQVRPP
jgi:hypothetical protein